MPFADLLAIDDLQSQYDVISVGRLASADRLQELSQSRGLPGITDELSGLPFAGCPSGTNTKS